MLPELGNLALILALCTAVLLSVVPLAGSAVGETSWMRMARPAAFLQLGLIGLSYACLTWSFVAHDFSVAYVANTSNSALPFMYLISGVWGGHEGSILLWCFTLAVWTGAVALFGGHLPEVLRARVLSVLGMVSVGFVAFTLLTSNPFERLYPVPFDGADLNPLLQDPGMAIHPPMLYMGYVGFAVAFAFAIAALMGGRLDAATLRWMRPWTNIAWAFLTVGISLGSFWAYYELGWGGWWFWDPVENASFMPWLVGTALIHSLAASEKRGVFKAWTVLLAVLAFSLSLLGTFLVRSGVLTSVHSFASDPTRGLYILLFLGVVVGGSLALYAVRAHTLKSETGWALVSRESGILLNNVLMVVACAAVLLGTLYPLALDALDMGKISVGPQYFDAVFVPLMLPVVALAGLGASLNWKKDTLAGRAPRLALLAAVSVGAAVVATLVGHGFHVGAVAALALAFWTFATVVNSVLHRVRNRRGQRLAAALQAPGAFWGMTLAHFGIGVFAIGVALVSIRAEEVTVRMAPGDTHEMAGYRFTFDEVSEVRGPNYSAARAHVLVSDAGEAPGAGAEPVEVWAEKRIYDVRREAMTEAGIDAGITRDLFVALGEPLEGGAWSVRLQVKPFVRWIWIGTVFMALGGVVAAADRRYRFAAKRAGAVGEAASARPGAGVAGAGGAPAPARVGGAAASGPAA